MESMRVASPAVASCRLNYWSSALGPAGIERSEEAMPAFLKLCPKRVHTVHVEGPLRMPVSRSLRDNVRALLRRGERLIVLDLSGVSRIDAAGVGELIRTFNMTAAMNGALRIVNATGWVREMLERAHLVDLLTAETVVEQRRA
jgi:anti-anti-sigma factor